MMAQATTKGRHKKSSTLTEMFKLAGDMMGDGMIMMMGKTDDEASLDDGETKDTGRHWGDESTIEETGGMRELRNEFQSQSYHDDADSYTTTASEELRQDRVRQIRQREMDNYRRQREVGDDRELELKQKLSQFEEEFLSESQDQDADPDFVYHGPSKSFNSSPVEEKTTTPTEKKHTKNIFDMVQGKTTTPTETKNTKKNIFEMVQERAMLALSGGEDESDEEETLITEEEGQTIATDENVDYEEEEEEEEEDDFADQIVHEMMQLLHHSRKNRNEAERLIEYKRAFIRQRHETNSELDAHILKNANYKKLECSTRRFVRHLEDGDVPRTEQTLGMERELQQNVAAMRDIRRESDELDIEFESMFDAAE